MELKSEEFSGLSPEKVRILLNDNGVAINDFQWELLQRWATSFQQMNQSLNLVSRQDMHRLWERHVLSCLALLVVRDIPGEGEICDFGTGGGLPGILLAIVRPNLQITMLDSTNKKIQAVQSFIQELSLPNAQAVWGRGEDLGKQAAYRQRFPVIVSRAVSSIKHLVQWTAQLRAKTSVLHLYKGGNLQQELKEVRRDASITRIEHRLITLRGYPRFAQDEKKIVSLYFNS